MTLARNALYDEIETKVQERSAPELTNEDRIPGKEWRWLRTVQEDIYNTEISQRNTKSARMSLIDIIAITIRQVEAFDRNTESARSAKDQLSGDRVG